MRWLLILLLGFGLAVTDPALAGNKGGKSKDQNKAQQHKNKQQHENKQIVASLISAVEISLIRTYLHNYRSDLPAVFAEAKPLPPGIAKKIARGGRLPPGIAKRHFPANLIARLPQRPGERWLVTGKDIVLLEVATGLIVDILHDTF